MTVLDIRVPPRTGQVRPRRSMHELLVDKARRQDRHAAGHQTTGTGTKTEARFLLKPLSGRAATMPPFDAAYVVEGHSRYPAMRFDPMFGPVLKSGRHQAKIGGQVRTGKWQGMPIYCLTLEERATCPSDCQLWRSCYGNGMNWAHRFEHGPRLELILQNEVKTLARHHEDGFVVRLHILGDFYSVEYVDCWAHMLAQHKELRVFGYTARWRRDDPIAQALLKLAFDNWDRFAIRFSNAPVETASTITITHAAQKPADAFICPEQLGQTESCSTCGLCWQTDKRVAFIQH